MTKSELIESLALSQNQITKKEAEVVVNTVLNAISGSLASGERVELRGFGSFGLRYRRARQGRNPKSGENVSVDAKTVAHFKPGKELRKMVDG